MISNIDLHRERPDLENVADDTTKQDQGRPTGQEKQTVHSQRPGGGQNLVGGPGQRRVAGAQYTQTIQPGPEMRGPGDNQNANEGRGPLGNSLSGNEARLDALLGRIITHIDENNQRHSDALSAINERLDQLSHRVQAEEDVDNGVEPQVERLSSQVSGLQKQLKVSAFSTLQREGGPTGDDENWPEADYSVAANEGDLGSADIVYTVEDTNGDRDRSAFDQEAPQQKSDEDIGLSSDRYQAPAETISKDDRQVSTGTVSHDRHDFSDTHEAEPKPFDSESAAMEAVAAGFETLSQDFRDADTLGVSETTSWQDRANRIEAERSVADPKVENGDGAKELDYGIHTRTGLMSPADEPVDQRLDELFNKFEQLLKGHHTEDLLATIQSQVSELPQFFTREEKREDRIALIEANLSRLTDTIEVTNQTISELSGKLAEETADHVVSKLDFSASEARLEAIDQYLRSLKEERSLDANDHAKKIGQVQNAIEEVIGRLDTLEPVDRREAGANTRLAGKEQQAFERETFEADEKDGDAEFASSQSIALDEQSDALRRAEQSEAMDEDDDIDAEDESDEFDDVDISEPDHEDGVQSSRLSANSAFLDSARRIEMAARPEGQGWDQQIGQYSPIRNKTLSTGSKGAWIGQNKTLIAAVLMVAFSAGAGLLLSRLGSTDVASNDKTAPANEIAAADAQSEQNNDLPVGALPPSSTSRIVMNNAPQQNPALGNLRRQQDGVVPGLRRQSLGDGVQGQFADQQKTRQPVGAKTPERTSATKPDLIPGVAIGHVSQPHLRRQLHQSVHGQQVVQKTSPNSQPSSLVDFRRAERPSVAPATTSAIKEGLPDRTNSAVHKTLPPAEIGPMSLRLAAAEGDPLAEYEVASRFARGHGVKRDLTAAVGWFKRSSSKGYAPAQYRLATHLERGAGVERNVANAKNWYLQSAQAGNVKAMHNLAVLHTGRDGQAPDYPTAARWFSEAAKYGLADSQYNLAILHENGLGVERNVIEAYKWMSLAARSGDGEAAKRQKVLRGQLNLSAVTKAERLALSWRPAAIDPRANIQASSPNSNGWTSAPADNSISPSKHSSVFPTSPNLSPASQPVTAALLQPTVPTSPGGTLANQSPATAPLDLNVRKVQLLLQKLGYDIGQADGRFGPKTRQAILAFEQRAGMKASGEVTTALLERLNALSL